MVTLITGASGGLGGAVVHAFLEDPGTSQVFGVARAWPARPVDDARFHPVDANLSIESECVRVARLAAPVDVLVHLMGGFAGGKTVAETGDDVWEQMMTLNLRSAFHIFRAVLPQMVAAGRGRIVAVGSRAAVEPMPHFGAYSVSKAGLVALVKTIALEVKDAGVTANVVMPSIIDSAANRSAMPHADFHKWVSPESIANLVHWLASAQAADVNGAVIPIYGRA
jgi:NAD(P)-dependent dehydrogenase (short-subunit alcohol dehydrogenase family)